MFYYKIIIGNHACFNEIRSSVVVPASKKKFKCVNASYINNIASNKINLELSSHQYILHSNFNDLGSNTNRTVLFWKIYNVCIHIF